MRAYRPEQPEWLRRQVSGIEYGFRWYVLIDGRDFAVVKAPGHHYTSGQQRPYGTMSCYLVDKRNVNPHDAFRNAVDIHDGGRVKKEKLAIWKEMVELSDEQGEFVILQGGGK